MEYPDRPSPSPSSSSPSSTPIPSAEQTSRPDSPALPLTLTTSTILTTHQSSLPAHITKALSAAGTFPPEQKCIIKFKPVGSAPGLKQDVCKISAERRFEEVVRYLRKKLRVEGGESVFLYVNSAFAPSLDEVVGNLHRCFKNGNDQLIVAYSITPAFG